MAFWLAKKRHSQETSFIQRFDPRFWTVNFPRPAMASVISTGADSMRVDVEVHNEGDLVGLIWESQDTLDHPLLAYTTLRDYSHTTLSFRWQSSNVIPLDQPFGPTLTIEGRGKDGTAQTWYIRLWNYASGDPNDALITLPFSSLESGYGLPGIPINAADIDRMFISIVPEGYVSGSNQPLISRTNGSVEISKINADGRNAVIEIGDVRMPVHGERMATAYDDAYNQSPARLIRNTIGLGYRTDLLHYVGMSHFMQLERQADGALLADPQAQICEPAKSWHSNFFETAANYDLEVIASISYELFDAYCPDHWKQRTATGDPALTGWVPPSTLLSPANTEAMQWVQTSAEGFVDLLERANQQVRFQIGEPWWWVTQAGEICLYDDAAKTALGGNPPVIDDMRAALSSEQTNLLDDAGEILAQSTANLKASIRAAASNSAEVLLLAFTPTILDPEMPQLYRANLPIGWAYPAFDRLQLEDYDWLTAGAASRRRDAYLFVDNRLGYPLEYQDYLSGFVLGAENAEAYWALIDHGLNEAEERGVSRRYIWAMPQICRDGYSRLSQNQEDSMEAFDNVFYPFALGRTTTVAPEFSTSVSVTSSGHEHRNSLWSDARVHFDVGPGIRSEAELSELIAFFRARRGAAKGFLISDPYDHSSNGMTGNPTPQDQLIGTGDGTNTDFQLIKSYGTGPEAQTRPIRRPRSETVKVCINGIATSDWELINGGTIRFETAPSFGAEIRAGFLFDVPVRFAEDRIDISGVNFSAGDAPSIPLIELREVD